MVGPVGIRRTLAGLGAKEECFEAGKACFCSGKFISPPSSTPKGSTWKKLAQYALGHKLFHPEVPMSLVAGGTLGLFVVTLGILRFPWAENGSLLCGLHGGVITPSNARHT